MEINYPDKQFEEAVESIIFDECDPTNIMWMNGTVFVTGISEEDANNVAAEIEHYTNCNVYVSCLKANEWQNFDEYAFDIAESK
jgi:hypothetical protein